MSSEVELRPTVNLQYVNTPPLSHYLHVRGMDGGEILVSLQLLHDLSLQGPSDMIPKALSVSLGDGRASATQHSSN